MIECDHGSATTWCGRARMPSSLPLYLRTWRSIFAMQRSIELYMFSVVSWPAIDSPLWSWKLTSMRWL